MKLLLFLLALLTGCTTSTTTLPDGTVTKTQSIDGATVAAITGAVVRQKVKSSGK